MTDEVVEGRDTFLEKRDPDYGRFKRYFCLPASNSERIQCVQRWVKLGVRFSMNAVIPSD
jgi:hypothetical protein